MNQRTVTKVERLLEEQIEVVLSQHEDGLPVAPTPELVRAMAKAATAVYEAVADDR